MYKCPHCNSKEITYSKPARKGTEFQRVVNGRIAKRADFIDNKLRTRKEYFYCNNCGKELDLEVDNNGYIRERTV